MCCTKFIYSTTIYCIYRMLYLYKSTQICLRTTTYRKRHRKSFHLPAVWKTPVYTKCCIHGPEEEDNMTEKSSHLPARLYRKENCGICQLQPKSDVMALWRCFSFFNESCRCSANIKASSPFIIHRGYS